MLRCRAVDQLVDPLEADDGVHAVASSGFIAPYKARFDLAAHLVGGQSPQGSVAFPVDELRSRGLRFDESMVVCEDLDFLLRCVVELGVVDTGTFGMVYRRWTSAQSSMHSVDPEVWEASLQQIVARLDAEPLVLPPGSASRMYQAGVQEIVVNNLSDGERGLVRRCEAGERRIPRRSRTSTPTSNGATSSSPLVPLRATQRSGSGCSSSGSGARLRADSTVESAGDGTCDLGCGPRRRMVAVVDPVLGPQPRGTGHRQCRLDIDELHVVGLRGQLAQTVDQRRSAWFERREPLGVRVGVGIEGEQRDVEHRLDTSVDEAVGERSVARGDRCDVVGRHEIDLPDQHHGSRRLFDRRELVVERVEQRGDAAGCGGDDRLAAEAEVVDACRSWTHQLVQLRRPALDRRLLQPGACGLGIAEDDDPLDRRRCDTDRRR